MSVQKSWQLLSFSLYVIKLLHGKRFYIKRINRAKYLIHLRTVVEYYKILVSVD
jgi:hypothetical protein